MVLTAVLVMAVWPRIYTTSVGGVSVDVRQPSRVAYHDTKTGYFVYKTMDCDGGHRSVMLTKDRRNITTGIFDASIYGVATDEPVGRQYLEQIQEKPFRLSTGHGIQIGDKRQDVIRTLGLPTKTARRGPRGQYWCALYKSVAMETKEHGRVLRNTYIFKDDRLIEISLNLDGVPGCGTNSLSDRGWPWTRF